MLDKIIQFSIKNKFVIGVMTIALIVWGVWSANRIPIDALPDVTNNQVQVMTTAPTLAAQEVEQFITFPIEKAMANLPDLVEMRSFSRFGLSVVTLVFKEDVNIYFARQLISERLKDAESQIPSGMGIPELAPVTTGLGEIYQYTIHPKKGSESKYSAMDLRTLQDWIVARQLYGIPGVAEVTGFGGISKQYEVAINPEQLKAMNVTIPEIFEALRLNNENTGGAYIDKKPNAYFIRGVGMVTSITDIENILIKRQPNGIPVTIRDIAKVQFGSPPRYGAMTYNGEKEVVGGIVLMLKGANSAQVVERVKERMKTVKASLPSDIIIEPFLDRSNLIKRAINTVKTNLVEGALIVIFVLVLFLGNLRAGLIVASAIPLSLLFALGMMNVFGVSANLMSLGAIDFGLIVDGAVIIVEATLHHLALRKSPLKLTQQEMDTEVYESASKIRKSAAFGEIIILIVYIPILTLIGVEGKMFRPMAQTVGFAILGALILSLTYIPMISALFLPKVGQQKKTFADRMMAFFQKLYAPVLDWAIRFKYAVVASAFALLVLAVLLFNRMGGEFIPTLEEGDFAIEFVLPQGASISQTTETVLQAERMLKRYPEVKMVIGKTGSADVATDPMPPEASDLMVILKDKKEWRTTKDFYALGDSMRETLSQIPGVIAEPSQPIQMRFNELMSGIRQDVAVKIFGENLDTLLYYGEKVAAAIRPIEGITQPQVERISGLPQITVQYDRRRMAGYGLNVADVNQVITTAFAGGKAGVVYENERKFDLVVRLDSAYRNSIEDVSNLYVPTADGNQVPLSQVATIAYQTGPAQISREDGRRRIVVSFNVNGRDVESVVKEVQKTLNQKVKLTSGYYYSYGGTFENLQQASARLRIAVPAALLLIFVLLYFTFHSVKQAALIFSAIPMSAIGGVLALLLRGMPFSISAGVGFIALFGVAVLNGIVLIGQFNALASEGVTDVIERIKQGTRIRLRPVLMTATVASLGFLPMALSNSAGAEVQKPLATVVIGGLITATLLTLIVIPVLYLLFSGNKKRPDRVFPKVIAVVALLLVTSVSFAQTGAVRASFLAVYDTALQNNLQLQASDLQIQQAQTLKHSWLDLPKTGVFVENEDLSPEDSKGILKIGLSQSVEWPTVYKARRNLLEQQVKSVELSRQLRALEIKRDVQTAYYTLWYLQSKQQLWQRLDSIYRSLAAAARLKVKTGESAGLDSIAAIVRSREIAVQLSVLQHDMATQQELLKRYTNTATLFLPEAKLLEKVSLSLLADTLGNHPSVQVQRQNVAIASAELYAQRQAGKPSFDGRFYSQRLYGIDNPYSGFSVSVGIPLFGRAAYKNRVRAAELQRDYQNAVTGYELANLQSTYQQAFQQLQKEQELLRFYESTGLNQAEAIIKAANIAYRAGESSFADLQQFVTQAIEMQRAYLDALHQYNQSAIQLNYYLNK
ncbi:CusA/CzcA family heavy metal efflux RND transporter [Flavisolibacter tropicus]|uniref:Acriflavine resistance protein B n=1 Tax=Flavisolibacter tropicus TaxID=1492898 RepID=A0A172TVH8_9BACT|nr:CusA/CzcA family heavy metal efflux RND transporter [Flavisolibacter tropicus]ANE50884.1 acriflavine resistance protein B [Flavisolibacter tropicus]